MTKLKKMKKNIKGRDFITGDIHGSFDLLMKKIESVNFNPLVDRLISVGDIINKGNDSDSTINLLDQEWFHPVLGNHEWMMLEWYDYGNYLDTLRRYGGKWFLRKEREEQGIIVDKLREIPIAIELDVGDISIGVIHAEVPYDNWKTFVKELNGKYPEKLISEAVWSRVKIDTMDKTKVKGIKEVYVGHTIVEKQLQLGNVNYIDTGAFYYGNMTLINLTEKYN